jgi:hypothetical protein
MKEKPHGVPDHASPDPLGETIKKYEVTWAGILVVCGSLAVLGLGSVLYGLFGSIWSLGFLLVGAAVILCAIVLAVMNVFNVGRSLELRRHGLRFVDAGIETEFLWSEVVEIEVNRTDDTNMGLVSVEKRSADAVSPSGPLTKTEWQVTIHAGDGRSINLNRAFMRMVPDPKELISNLKMRSGVG